MIQVKNNKTIGISDFVKRQLKDNFIGTKLKIEELYIIHSITEQKYNLEVDVKDGYADFCKLVTIKECKLECPISKITPESKSLLVTDYKVRKVGELPFLSRYFPKGTLSPSPSHHLTVILYSKEQLQKEGDDFSGSDYDIICINAEVDEKDAPMTPETIIRNHLGKEFGGSGVKIDYKEYFESVDYWSKYAMIEY